jgi:hypothetical protein
VGGGSCVLSTDDATSRRGDANGNTFLPDDTGEPSSIKVSSTYPSSK